MRKTKEEVISHPGVIDPIQATSFNLRIPRNIQTAPILVVLLIVAAFFLGMLTTKVQYLQKQADTTAKQPMQGMNMGQGTQPQQQQPQPTLGKQNVDNGHFPVRGQDTAKVTVIEFGDFRCPFCEKVFTDVEPQLQKDYIDTGKVKFYFRQYAFLGPASTVAANAAECANEQNKFWDMHDYLYKNQPSETDTSMYTTANLAQIAGQLGMDTNQFSTCLDSKKYDKNVSNDLAAGQKVGVSATPTFYIDGNQLVGAQPYSAFQTIIDQELKK